MNNLTNANRFRFLVNGNEDKYRLFENQCNGISLPDVSLGIVRVPNPIKQFYLAGDSLEFTSLSVTFLVDEDYEIWRECFQWILDNKNNEELDNEQTTVDCSVMILSNKFNPLFSINFEDVFPVNMSSIRLAHDVNSNESLEFDVIFRFNNMNIK